jgi:hypothetical protein
MFDSLFAQLAPRYRGACIRSLRAGLLRMGRIDLHPTFSDPDCCDWENAWLMGGEL